MGKGTGRWGVCAQLEKARAKALRRKRMFRIEGDAGGGYDADGTADKPSL